jgi:hypothetical protein
MNPTASPMTIAVAAIVSLVLAENFASWTSFWVVNAQTDSACQGQLSEYASCLVDQFDSQNDAALCDQCRLDYANALANASSSELTCENIENVQCSAVLECPCGGCAASLEAYLNCEVSNYNNSQCSAGINCRTSIVNCLNSFDEYRDCLYRLPLFNDTAMVTTTANGKACDNCRIQVAANFSNGGSCDMAQSNFCTGATETCAVVCGNCVDELDFYYTCDVLDKSNGNCQLNCGTVSTPPISEEPLCNASLANFALCVTDNIAADTERVACDTCRLQAEQSALNVSMLVDPSSGSRTCSIIQEAICNEAAPTCADACGTCVATLAEYWICSTSTQSLVNCSSIACKNLSPPPTAQPGPTATPLTPTVGAPTAPASDGSPPSLSPTRKPTAPTGPLPPLPVSRPASMPLQDMTPTASSAYISMKHLNVFGSLLASFLVFAIEGHIWC